MWFLRLVKKFVQADGINKAFLLGSLSLIIIIALYALIWFGQVNPKVLGFALTLEAFKLILGICGLVLFIIGVKWIWKDRAGWKDYYCHDWQISCLIIGIAAVIGGWCLTSVVLNVADMFSVTLPVAAPYYATTVGGFFIVVSIFTFLWKIIQRGIKKMWDALKDAYRRA